MLRLKKIKRHCIMQSNLVSNLNLLFLFWLYFISVSISCLLLGQIEVAKWLINYGANVNVADENHNTALHYAVNAELGHVEILELLSKHDNINNFKKDDKSLLHLSIEKGIFHHHLEKRIWYQARVFFSGGDIETFKWLLDKGANIKVTDGDGRSILHSAARYG